MSNIWKNINITAGIALFAAMLTMYEHVTTWEQVFGSWLFAGIGAAIIWISETLRRGIS